MDKVINAHIDKVEEIEKAINEVIDKAMAEIDIEEVIAAPSATLAAVVEKVKRTFLDDYANKAVELGVEFGQAVTKKIEQDKTIKVDKSKDPTLNKEDDTSEN